MTSGNGLVPRGVARSELIKLINAAKSATHAPKILVDRVVLIELLSELRAAREDAAVERRLRRIEQRLGLPIGSDPTFALDLDDGAW